MHLQHFVAFIQMSICNDFLTFALVFFNSKKKIIQIFFLIFSQNGSILSIHIYLKQLFTQTSNREIGVCVRVYERECVRNRKRRGVIDSKVKGNDKLYFQLCFCLCAYVCVRVCVCTCVCMWVCDCVEKRYKTF